MTICIYPTLRWDYLTTPNVLLLSRASQIVEHMVSELELDSLTPWRRGKRMGFINPKVEGSNPSLGLFLLYFYRSDGSDFCGSLNQQIFFVGYFSCHQRRKLKNFDSLQFFLESLVKDIVAATVRQFI